MWPNVQESKQQNTTTEARITFRTQRGILFVDPAQVVYLRAQSNYTEIHDHSGRFLLISKTLKDCAEKFPGHFLRTHQSYLVNPLFIQFYSKAESSVTLDNNIVLPVSRAKRKLLNALWS